MRTSAVSSYVTSLSIIAAIVAALGATGCKGETVVKDNPQTLDELEACKRNAVEQAKLVKALEDEKARLAMNQPPPVAEGEIVVNIQDDILVVKPPGNGSAPKVDPKVAAALSQQFIDTVTKSRGGIQKCYEQLLKKDSSLQNKSQRLTITSQFQATGVHKSSSFAPNLGDTFDTCMKAIAAKWTMPPNGPITTFKAPVNLTPS
jgi:hypothetical protein